MVLRVDDRLVVITLLLLLLLRAHHDVVVILHLTKPGKYGDADVTVPLYATNSESLILSHIRQNFYL